MPTAVYGQWKNEMEEQVYKLALLGAKDADIANFFNVSVKTIDYWKKHKPAFVQSLRKGKVEADMDVAKSYFKRAKGFKYKERTVKITDKGGVEYTVTDKTALPDAQACARWLSIRQREQWAEITHTEHTITHKGSVDIRHISEQIQNKSLYSIEDLKLGASLGIKQQMMLTENIGGN